MANTQIDMRKIKQIFKLYSEGVSKRKISLIIGLSRNTTTKYINFFKRYSLTSYEVSAGNAVKFTEVGEIEFGVRRLKQHDEKITLRFSVSDTGIGIPQEKQKRIFDAFTQEDSSVSKKYGGTGLGLTISNNLLNYMGTNLLLESEVEKGSVFYFDIEVPYDIEDMKDDEGDMGDIGRITEQYYSKCWLIKILNLKQRQTVSKLFSY
jgi:light-regulated signal transduction histidine kinase (bacteriophytochrome)